MTRKLCPVDSCGVCEWSESCRLEYGEQISPTVYRFPKDCPLDNDGEIPGWLKVQINDRIKELQSHADMFRDTEPDLVYQVSFMIRELFGVLSLKRGEE